MEYNPYKDLIISRKQHVFDPLRKHTEEFHFPHFKLRKNLNPEFETRKVENFTNRFKRTPKEPAPEPPQSLRGDAPDPKKPHRIRSNGSVDAGVDPALRTNAVPTSEGMNLTAGKSSVLNTPPEGTIVKNEQLPGGEGTLRSDGVIVDKNGALHPPGSRANPIARDSMDVPPRKTPNTDPNSQHNPEKLKDAKGQLANKLMMGVMLLPSFLPLAFLLTAFIQGEVACDQLDGKEFSIDSAVSARQPVYPDGTPDWVKNTFSINKTKVKIGFSPCVKILSTDSIAIHNSNVFDGSYSISSGDECSIVVDIGKEFTTANAFSNTAQFTLSTSCSDRMAYAAGQDALFLAQTAATGAQGLAQGLLGGIPWSGILMVLALIVAIMIAFKGISVFTGKS